MPEPSFAIGTVRWDVGHYAQSLELSVFRRHFNFHCGNRRGIDAARCIANIMTASFPWGNSRHEFFDAGFDPALDFAAHLDGEPGHCVTRSGIAVTELLSVGNPARVAQLFNSAGRGHNIVEVWDQTHGWVLFDPSFGGELLAGDRFVSAATAIASPTLLRVSGSIPTPLPASAAAAFYGDPIHPVSIATILFPSPFRYLRTGPRAVGNPFRGRFARLGDGWFKFGGAQNLLRLSMLLTIVFPLLVLFRAVLRARARVPLTQAPRTAIAESSLPQTPRSSNALY